MDMFQFYPTPESLATRAWAKFQNRTFRRILEPSAGDGALAKAIPGHGWRNSAPVDCVEIDISKHPLLRTAGFKVVGFDFLQFGSAAIYSHIILNPPFAQGAEHVLKAWDVAWDAEIVAILNAETVRNPYTKERAMLVKLIEQYGSVEFIEGAFTVPEAERKTEVDVALVYLRKEADGSAIVGNITDELKKDAMSAAGLAGDYHEVNELALPQSMVENAVLTFNAAVKAVRESIIAQARANHYVAAVGETMAVRNSDSPTTRSRDTSVEWVQGEMEKEYLELKDRAWAGILRSTQVASRLSSKAQSRLEAQFEEVKTLEFTVSNIYGFLQGLVQSQGEIQLAMACDVFDLIMCYHSDNAVFYKGWRSNDRHRSAGMRIKTTRFIIPRHGDNGWRTTLSWDSEKQLADFDKVFAMLDGKLEPEFGLVQAFRTHFKELKHGKRITTSYFDVRWYPGVGTIHFFPRDKALVDRLNRLVGRQRQWLPPEDDRVSDAFWEQYKKAEKFDKEVRTEINARARGSRFWEHPLNKVGSRDQEQNASALAAIDEAMDVVLQNHGIDVERLLEPAQKRLIAA
jgi:hypothetical protein